MDFNDGIINVIKNTFNINENEILDMKTQKKGMTNRSVTFTAGGKAYIFRIPGEGTDRLINRKQEHSVYQVISPLKICDDIVYFNPDDGCKISRYIEDARVCDPMNFSDIKACMKRLREFHDLKLRVDHNFDVFERIEFYESLWDKKKSCFGDYQTTKANVMQMKYYIDSIGKEWILAHIDAVPDNFLFVKEGGKERILMIDWEYAGMQDPHMDIAMFAVYSSYDRGQIDALIDCYFTKNCSGNVRKKIYAYIAMCGLLWSNWCEYKRQLGVEFGEYALQQYRYAKDYCLFFAGE